MIGEVATTAINVAKEAGKKAAEISVETAKEISKKDIKTSDKPIDITKRIDITRAGTDVTRKGIDITKRIQPEIAKEVSDISLSEMVQDYLSDLKEKSSCAETLKNASIDVSKLEIQSPDKVAKMREAFDDNKANLRRDWEKLNNREWPKYKEDIYNENGTRIRKAGDNFDAHHITPLQLGGTNEVSNLTPLDISKHKEVHLPNGGCNKLVDAVRGVERI